MPISEEIRALAALCIAGWGAITGTLGFLLGLANLRRDRGRLVLSAELAGDWWSAPRLKIRIANRGRRVVSPRLVQGSTNRVSRWQQLETLDGIELTEGKQTTVELVSGFDDLPVDIRTLRRVSVVDTTGRRWRARSVDRRNVHALLYSSQPIAERRFARGEVFGWLARYQLPPQCPERNRLSLVLMERSTGSGFKKTWVATYKTPEDAQHTMEMLLALKEQDLQAIYDFPEEKLRCGRAAAVYELGDVDATEAALPGHRRIDQDAFDAMGRFITA